MLSDQAYAKFFGEGLLKEIFHLDEELKQAVAIKQDPAVEEELERSLDVALSEAEVEGNNLLNEAKKKPKFHVYSAFGGTLLSSHHSESAANKAAAKHSHKQPVHIWTAEGGAMGMGKPIAHYHNGEKTVYEDFERGLDAMLEAELATPSAAPKKPKRKISDARRNRFHEFLKSRSYCTRCQENGHNTKDCNAPCPTYHGQGRFSRRGCMTCGEYMEDD